MTYRDERTKWDEWGGFVPVMTGRKDERPLGLVLSSPTSILHRKGALKLKHGESIAVSPGQ